MEYLDTVTLRFPDAPRNAASLEEESQELEYDTAAKHKDEDTYVRESAQFFYQIPPIF